jgi:hypothetical protein
MKILMAIGLLLAAVVLHFVGVFTGIYDAQLAAGFVWFDNVLHVAVGIAFGLVWVSILERVHPTASFTLVALTTLAFVVAMAAAWELFEYAFYLVFKSGALGLKVYSPSVNEALFDSLSNTVGAVLLLCAWFVKTRATVPEV